MFQGVAPYPTKFLGGLIGTPSAKRLGRNASISIDVFPSTISSDINFPLIGPIANPCPENPAATM